MRTFYCFGGLAYRKLWTSKHPRSPYVCCCYAVPSYGPSASACILSGPDKLDKVQMHRVCAPPMSRLSNLGMGVRGRCGVYIHDMPCTYHYRTGLHSPKQVMCVLMHIHICSTKTTFIIRGQNQSITMRADQESSGRNVKEVAQSTRCS